MLSMFVSQLQFAVSNLHEVHSIKLEDSELMVVSSVFEFADGQKVYFLAE